jgi:hypothetical protein
MVCYCLGAGLYSPVHEFLNIYLALFILSLGIRGNLHFLLCVCIFNGVLLFEGWTGDRLAERQM